MEQRSRFRSAIPVAICLIGLLAHFQGCGGDNRPFVDNSKDPQAFALTVKQMLIDSIADAKDAKEPGDTFEALVQVFDGKLDGNQLPVGDYLEIYREVWQTSQEFAKKCADVDGRPSDLNAGLDKLKSLAERLPGETKAARGSAQPARSRARDPEDLDD